MGAKPEDYKSLLPPGSYIHVDDFQSPEHLAEYLKMVDKNDTLYNSYFRWKESWTAVRYKSVHTLLDHDFRPNRPVCIIMENQEFK